MELSFPGRLLKHEAIVVSGHQQLCLLSDRITVCVAYLRVISALGGRFHVHGGEGAAGTAATEVWHELLVHSVFLPFAKLTYLSLIVELNLVLLPLSAVVLRVDRVHLIEGLFGRHVLPGEAFLIQTLVLRTDILARRWPSLDHGILLRVVRVVSVIYAIV